MAIKNDIVGTYIVSNKFTSKLPCKNSHFILQIDIWLTHPWVGIKFDTSLTYQDPGRLGYYQGRGGGWSSRPKPGGRRVEVGVEPQWRVSGAQRPRLGQSELENSEVEGMI